MKLEEVQKSQLVSLFLAAGRWPLGAGAWLPPASSGALLLVLGEEVVVMVGWARGKSG